MQTIELTSFVFRGSQNPNHSEAIITITERTGWLWWRKTEVTHHYYSGFRALWRNKSTGHRAEGEVQELLEEKWYLEDWRRVEQNRCPRQP